MKKRKDLRSIRDKLLHEKNGECAYCGKKLHSPLEANIDHFYPYSQYPELGQTESNLILSCRECCLTKSNKFPVDENGQPLLVNPYETDLSKHLKQTKNGLIEGITENGRAMIETLRLNKESLIKQRMLKVINMDIPFEGQISATEVCDVFEDSLNQIESLNSLNLPESLNSKEYMSSMLYANVITAVETYLCDRFVSIINSNKDYLLSFVENFKDFKSQKITLSNIFSEYELIEEKAFSAIKDVLYHNLPKVSGIYCSTLNIDFPDYVNVFKAVTIRHDLVHRGGKTKDGNYHKVKPVQVDRLLKDVRDFYSSLENAIEKI